MTTFLRADWHADPPRSTTKWKRTPTGYAIHWCGTSSAISPNAEPLGIVRRLQADAFTEDYEDVEYSWFVALNGAKIEGRGWGVQSGATGGQNSRLLSICALMGVGNRPTLALLQGLAELIAEGNRYHRMTHYTVQPHLDFKQTACPGPDLTHWVREGLWRKAVIAPPPKKGAPMQAAPVILQPTGPLKSGPFKGLKPAVLTVSGSRQGDQLDSARLEVHRKDHVPVVPVPPSWVEKMEITPVGVRKPPPARKPAAAKPAAKKATKSAGTAKSRAR